MTRFADTPDLAEIERGVARAHFERSAFVHQLLSRARRAVVPANPDRPL